MVFFCRVGFVCGIFFVVLVWFCCCSAYIIMFSSRSGGSRMYREVEFATGRK